MIVMSSQVRRLDIVMCSYSSDLLDLSLSSDHAAETSLYWDPFVTMNPQLRHSMDGDVSRSMSSMEKVVGFDFVA